MVISLWLKYGNWAQFTTLYIRERLFYKVQVQTIELENKISSFKKSTPLVGLLMSNLWGAFQEAYNLAFFILPIVQCETSPRSKSELVV